MIWTKIGLASAVLMMGASPNVQPSREYHLSLNGQIIAISLSREPVKMISGSENWTAKSAPIVVTISGTAPDVSIWGRPTYGLTTTAGSQVYVSMDAKYKARGDTECAQRGSAGVPIRPNFRSTDGYAIVPLALYDREYLLLRVTIRKGYGAVSLVDPTHPSANIRSR